MITDAQRDLRRSGIFSSDCPAILNLLPYTNPGRVWREKVEGATKEKTSSMNTGNFYENANLDWAADKLAVQIEKSPDTLTRIHEGILHGSHLDARGIDDKKRKFVMESKVCYRPFDEVALYGDWGRAGSDQVPFGVACQVQHQLWCAGDDYQIAYVVALRIWSTRDEGKGLGPGLYVVHRDNEAIAQIVNQTTSWWRQFIIPKVMPPIPEKEAA